MKKSSRVIIENHGKIMFVHRKKQGHEYFFLPGSGLHKDETFCHAAVREAKEETA
jgi:ADP-ribose pyrophosphatase YjhB (NUDIX family)